MWRCWRGCGDVGVRGVEVLEGCGDVGGEGYRVRGVGVKGGCRRGQFRD